MLLIYLFSIPFSQKPLKMNDHHLWILQYPGLNCMRCIYLTLVTVLLNFTTDKMVGDALLYGLPILGDCHRQCQLFICCTGFVIAKFTGPLVQQLDTEVFGDWAGH